MPGNRLTAAGAARFLDALAETASVSAALDRSGTPRASVYRRRRADPAFAAAWDAALEVGLDLLRDEAVRRALEGSERPVFHGGVQVGTVRQTSDRLLMFLLRAHRRETYGDAADTKAQTLARAAEIEAARREGASAALDELFREIAEHERVARERGG